MTSRSSGNHANQAEVQGEKINQQTGVLKGPAVEDVGRLQRDSGIHLHDSR